MNLGQRITQLRADKSMDDFGASLGVSAQSVHQWEHGVTRPTLANILKLADMYGCSLDWLLLGRAGGPSAPLDVDYAIAILDGILEAEEVSPDRARELAAIAREVLLMRRSEKPRDRQLEAARDVAAILARRKTPE